MASIPNHVYVYKLTVDDGGAPCVAGGLLSLAICKPSIRKVAVESSWIYGFAGDTLRTSHPDNRLVYVARVDRRVSGQTYYATDSNYAKRFDCIYRWSNGKFKWEEGSNYHQGGGDLEHDLGSSEQSYDRSWILLSRQFRYFGCGTECVLPSAPRLRNLLNRLTQGHRCHIDDSTLMELKDLRVEAFALKGLAKSPTPSAFGRSCGGSCGCGTATNDNALPLAEC